MPQSRYFDHLLLNQTTSKLFSGGGCADYVDHKPNLKCVKYSWITQSWLFHQRATRHKFIIQMWGMSFIALVQCLDKLTSLMESSNTDRKCLKTLILTFLYSNDIQITPKLNHKPYKSMKIRYMNSNVQMVKCDTIEIVSPGEILQIF